MVTNICQRNIFISCESELIVSKMLTGINLQETRGKQAWTKTSTSPPSPAKRCSRKPGKESAIQVRRRIPRHLIPLQTNKVDNKLLW